ncbi:MAG: putative Ig domain-containing protein, partial [Gammaproteobacteria bacterium]|nr:putative Ig domain-containing protein [Gammaproteobacteria bacterium]
MLTNNHTKSYLTVWLCLFFLAQPSLVTALVDRLLYEPITDIAFISDKPRKSGEEIFIRIAVKNTSTEVLSGSFRIVVENASLPVTNADGLTQQNEPYFLLKKGDVLNVKPNRKVYSRIGFSQLEAVTLSYNLRLERRITPLVNKQPVANAGFDQHRKTGDQVFLDGSRSYDLDGEAISYDWLLEKAPLSSLVTLVNNGTVNPYFKLDVAGQYVIALLVNDGIENSHYDRVVITTSNVPPVAQAGASQLVIPGDIVQLDGSASSDANGDNLSYSWVIDQSPDGSAALIENADTVQAEINIDRSGEYIVRLKVNDGVAESGDDYITISDVSLPPVANAGLDQSAIINAIIQLDASASFALDAQPLTYNWSLISAPDNSSSFLSNVQETNPTIQIDKAGDYIAQLIVNDGSQSSFPDQMIISTGNIRPVARTGENRTVLVNALTQLNAANSFDADGDLLNYQWSVIHQPEMSAPSITNISDMIANFIADVSGQYVLQLVVNDGRLDSYADTILITADEQVNQPPVIQSAPVLSALTDILYSYTVIATDGNGNILTYSLTQSPAGMLIDSSSGLITWIPGISGSYPVAVLVSDGSDGEDTQQFTVIVEQLNQAPVIQSAPVISAQTDTLYSYDVVATDANGDGLTYALTQSPPGMIIDSTSGLISWTPTDTGSYPVAVQVSDGRGGVDEQLFVITVTQSNHAPVITSTPITQTTIDQLYSYQVVANDADADVLSYRLLASPLGMNINASTGLISWQVVNFETATVNIEVDDANGGISYQQYSVNTHYPTDNQPPVFAPLASQIVPIGTTLSLQFNAYDPEGKIISYSVLPLPLPANATLNTQTGTLLFEPQAGQDGEYNLVISASDSRFSTTQNLTITVPPLNLAAPTSFHGRVVDANSASQGVDLPIVGATISFLNTAVSIVTDAQGYFTLNNLPATAEVFSIDGSTANLAPGGASYASFRELLGLIQHAQNIEERPFYMPRNNMASMTQVDPNQ